MLQRLRNYLTPMVTTIALAVLTASALALSPEIVDRLGDDSQTQQLGDTADSGSLDAADTADTIDGLDSQDLMADEMEGDGDGATPTATPTATANAKPNHGHFVSCVAKMANSDPDLEGREKGAVVSAAARSEGEMVKDDEAACAAAYAAARSAALGETEETDGRRTTVSGKQEQKADAQESKTGAQNLKDQLPPPASDAGRQTAGQKIQNAGPPADHGKPVPHNAGGGPKK